MNIKYFEKGDIITRVESVFGDASYCGDRMVLQGYDEKSKIIFLIGKDSYRVTTLSWANKPFDEGWELFPEKLYQEIIKENFGSSELTAIKKP
ncbi:hypothetical protein E6Q11_04330 [Candidatus Dojkabacteria bacterium]|uniref:Uncharacterized protein n=1 Tax=Candidatus Dojkabacteria bacterium TaxID=2099670 RepID=A0A5C7J5B8_9BACT|nr:MAG: hypothetical protein E6Q11_04330 [Candidatus Dojkabacteria bacterium]